MSLLRGAERIRTAVKGFADLCLATRPQRHLFCKNMKKQSPIAKNGDCLILIYSSFLGFDLAGLVSPSCILSLRADNASKSPSVDFSTS